MNDQPDSGEGGAELPTNNRHALRRVARGPRKAALATSMDGRPYVSLVTVALDQDLSPILLLSRLSEHTRHLLADPRASLLLDGTEGHANPQTGPRVTLVGTAAEAPGPRLKARFLALHPGAALYADFADFAIWRLRLERAHFVGGFGRAVWFDAPLVPEAEALAACEDTLVAEVNAGGAEALTALAVAAGKAAEAGGWRLVAVDADGCDLAAAAESVRIAFPQPAEDGDVARRILADLMAAVLSGSTR